VDYVYTVAIVRIPSSVVLMF